MLIYWTSLSLSLIFSFLSEYNRYLSRYFFLLSFFSVFFICAFRFDVGSDYQSYIEIFYNIQNGNSSYVEPGFYLLNYIFTNVRNGWFFVFLVSSFLTLYPLFKLSREYSVLLVFIIILFASGFIFRSNNLVRQGIATSFLLLACSDLNSKKNNKFYFYIFIAGMFHYASFAFIMLKQLNKIKFNKKVIIGISLFSIVSSFFFDFNSLIIKSISLIPHYGEIYSVKLINESASSGTNLVVYFWALLSVVIFYFRSDCIYSKIYLMGSVLSLFTLEFSLVYRFLSYMTDFKLMAIPLFLRSFSVNNPITLLIRFFLILMFMLFIAVNIKNGISGSLPFKFIFE
ncbi:EpsG family protein [Photobacterium damselae subsp. damselae]|uniref:EpsG family protein n=1 Tax=Photobacterium damselae TaxID=38293 RepID=UPI0015F54498|nr:EpsG family protein [Photobacterium damselae subsp. damselae]